MPDIIPFTIFFHGKEATSGIIDSFLKSNECYGVSQVLDYSSLKGCLDGQGFTSLPNTLLGGQYDSLSIMIWACILTKIIKYY